MIRLCSRIVRPRIQVLRVPKGPRGTISTARLIACLIRSGAKDFYVRQKAIEIFRAYRVPPKDRWGEVCALFDSPCRGRRLGPSRRLQRIGVRWR